MMVKTMQGFPSTPAVEISLQNGMIALCDPRWHYVLPTVHWYAKKSRGRFYACTKVVTNGKTTFVRMHRMIAHTPDFLVCHHINGNSLDNRRANLQNITQFEHAKYYSYW